MYGLIRENLATKLVALVMAVLIWAFASLDTEPRTGSQRVLKAAVVTEGEAPSGLLVRLRQTEVPVSVSGPRAAVDALDDTSIKARAVVSGVRPEMSQVRLRYEGPPGVRDLQIIGQVTVAVEVSQRVRRSVRVTAVFDDEPPAGTTFGTPKVSPQRAYVVGSQEEVDRVSQVVAFIETGGASVRADIPLRALDANSVEMTNVKVEPVSAHVEMTLRQALSTRTLVVDARVTGVPGPPLTVASVRAEPAQVVVTGRPDQLQALPNIVTDPVDVGGIRGSISREAPLRLPPGVTVKDGQPVVRVRVEVRDPTAPVP